MLALVDPSVVLGFCLEHQYFAMFAILFLCGCGLPLPEEIPLIAAGVVVGFEKANFWLASLTCVSAILVGDSIIFFAGRFAGKKYPNSRFIKFINNKKVKDFFAKHGNKTVFFARFFAGIRMGVYAYAGQHGMSWGRLLFMDLLGALISGPTSVWLGKYAAERLGDTPDEALQRAQDLFHDNKPLIISCLVLLILFLIGFAVWKAKSYRKQFKEATAESKAAKTAEAAGEDSRPAGVQPETDPLEPGRESP